MMASCVLSGSSSRCAISASPRIFPFSSRYSPISHYRLRAAKASSGSSSDVDDDADCNTEECAPDKEVGKVSMEWLAGEKTKVVGTFPPRRNKGWTGYVEKDTAGQTNIYSVEPAVYIAESAISSGTAGSSADGSENTAAIVAGLALISVAAASSVLLQVGKNPPVVPAAEYSGPSLTYYINKFKPLDVIEASAPSVAETSTPLQTETETETETSTPLQTETSVQEVLVPEVQVETQQDIASPDDSIVS